MKMPYKLLLVSLLLAGMVLSGNAQDYPLNEVRIDRATYNSLLKDFPDDRALPPSYDARDDGIVTPAKNQGSCGSCWAFAGTGAMESHLLKFLSTGPYDLSEQQQVSCNTSMGGCSGGSLNCIKYWITHGPIFESCFPYTASDATPCSYTCDELENRVVDFYTVSNNDFKTSLYEDGPSYWRFTVYSDFSSFWHTASPGQVYTNTSSTVSGGHAVLLIGWDDSKGAYLCKNSWGTTAGPNNDGTFWIAYSGHAHSLNFDMANFHITGNPITPDNGMYELRLDNTDPDHETSGTWEEYALPFAYGNNTVHAKPAGSGNSYFRYVLPADGQMELGQYAVYARWITNPVCATNTRYRIYTTIETYIDVRVNQQQNNGRWIKLGTVDVVYPRPEVYIYDDADGYVVAHGIRFVRLGPTPPSQRQ